MTLPYAQPGQRRNRWGRLWWVVLAVVAVAWLGSYWRYPYVMGAVAGRGGVNFSSERGTLWVVGERSNVTYCAYGFPDQAYDVPRFLRASFTTGQDYVQLGIPLWGVAVVLLLIGHKQVRSLYARFVQAPRRN